MSNKLLDLEKEFEIFKKNDSKYTKSEKIKIANNFKKRLRVMFNDEFN